MISISPVYSESEVALERVIALDQPEYYPIIILPVKYVDGTQGMCVRFEFTDEERKLIAEGADLLVAEITFGGNKFTPIAIEVNKRDVI